MLSSIKFAYLPLSNASCELETLTKHSAWDGAKSKWSSNRSVEGGGAVLYDSMARASGHPKRCCLCIVDAYARVGQLVVEAHRSETHECLIARCNIISYAKCTSDALRKQLVGVNIKVLALKKQHGAADGAIFLAFGVKVPDERGRHFN